MIRQLLIDCRQLITGRAGRGNAKAQEVIARLDAALAAEGVSIHPMPPIDEWWCPYCIPTDGAGCGSCTNYPKRLDTAVAAQSTAADDTPSQSRLKRVAELTAAQEEPVAWREKDGDEWVYYDDSAATIDTFEHISRYQKNRHNVSIFPLYTHPPHPQANEPPSSLTSGQGKVTDEMVNRFLAWKLPDDFSPDAGISFDPVFNKGTPYEMRHQPVGTNLLNFEQARVMLEHVLAVADQPAGVSK